MQSHIDSAEYGVVTGGVVNMLSKSGTKIIFYGSVWEFIRNNDFDARNSYSDFLRAPAGALPVPRARRLHRSLHYVSEISSALLPAAGLSCATKLFFYGAYEGWRLFRKPGLSQTLVPSAQELSGDFSTAGSLGLSAQVLQPLLHHLRGNRHARCNNSSATPAVIRSRPSTTCRPAERTA